MKIQARLDEDAAKWFRNQLLDQNKTETQFLRELVDDRRQMEFDFWAFIAKKSKGVNGLLPQLVLNQQKPS